jgi:hypothetical protein
MYNKVNSTHENMIRAVIGFALSAANIATTTLVAAFLALMNAIKANIDSIDTLRASIATSITGYAAQKKALKTALVEMSATIMKSVYAYAIANGDAVLAAQMKTSRSKMKKMKYVDLITYVGGAITIVTPLVASLGSYGITPVMMTAWSTANDQLEDVISNPRNAIANREAVNAAIQNTLRSCMLLLTQQADQLSRQFITIDETYYNTYWANRKLVDFHLSTQLRAHVQDELNQPIQGAVVSVDGTELSGTTDENGYILISKVPFGTHNVTVTTGTNVRNFGPYTFKKGHSLTVHFTTAPAFGSSTVTETPVIEETNS